MIKIVSDKKGVEIEVEGFNKEIIKEMCLAIKSINQGLRSEDEISAIAFQRTIIELQPAIFGEEQTKKVIEFMKMK